MRLRLVVPADVQAPTGGNVYDLALAAALRSGGDDVLVLPCPPSALGTVLQQRWPGSTLVDGLLACADPVALEAADAAVLVHLPLALDASSPGRAEALDALERRALAAARTVVATSAWAARDLRCRHGLTAVAVAAPGVDPAPLVHGSDPPLLVHLAALVPRKDQLSVVAALRRVAGLPWTARLAGPDDRDPAYAAAVRRAVHAAGLDERVEVPGALPRERAWAGADLALLPSRAETYGMAVTEALARGVPAVVAGGGAVEALGAVPGLGRPGAVVPPGDPSALAVTLRRWLEDEEQRQLFRVSARARRGTLARWDSTARSVRSALTAR